MFCRFGWGRLARLVLTLTEQGATDAVIRVKAMAKFIRVPHTLTLLFGMMVLAMIATWLVPQGFFDTQTLANGRSAVIPGTFTLV